MINLTSIRAVLPDRLKYILKPYFRTLLPNQLVALLWITFRCNYRCSYCNIVTNFNFGDLAGRDSEKTADQWLEALDKLPPTMFYFAGGEPFLYRELPELINELPTKHSVIGIVSNGTAKIDVYRRLKKRIGLNISFHREFVDEDTFISKIAELKDSFNVSVNIVATRENLPVIARLKDTFEGKEVSLHVDRMVGTGFSYTKEENELLLPLLSKERRAQADQLDENDYGTKLCGAGKNYINIFPDGQTYTCAGGMEYSHSPIVKPILDNQPEPRFKLDQFRMGNIFNPDFRLRERPIACSLPCRAACDRDFTSFTRVDSRKSRPVPA